MTELEGYRRQIDAIDAQLVELFLRRMEVTGAVGRYKQERGLPVLDAERERRVIATRPAGRMWRPCTRPSWAVPAASSASWCGRLRRRA